MSTLILNNARIYTLDPSRPRASGMVISNGVITRLLDRERSSVDIPGTEREDMDGKTILPGLSDAHIHLKEYALNLKKINCETGTKDACLQRVAQRAAKQPPGTWILGHGWNQNSWRDGYGTRAELDAVAPRHPVYLTAKSLHAAWVNSAALQEAGLHEDTPDPAGGRLSRDPQGKLGGLLFEKAIPLVADNIPEPDLQEIKSAMQDAQRSLWKIGLTAVHDFDRRLSFSALQELHQEGKLKLRVTKSLPVDDLDGALQVGLRSGFGTPLLHVGSIKAFADGALGPQTAAMIAPYHGTDKDRGIQMLEEEDILQFSLKAAEHGLSMAIHAIGDRANRTVLNAFQRVREQEEKRDLPSLRHRIEHVQLLHPQDVGRLAELKIIASMQPIHATSDMDTAQQYWGERSRYAYAWRSLLDHGTRLAFGSDAPVEVPNPFLGLYAAVSRRKPNGDTGGGEGWVPQQRISLMEALQAYTTGPAYAAGREDQQGKLMPGYWADCIVLEEDPFSTLAAQLPDMQPVRTMVNGEWVWHR